MVLQSSGAIKFSDIQTEFGGTNPIGMSEYYKGGVNVPSGTTGVPTTGAISVSTFYGKAKTVSPGSIAFTTVGSSTWTVPSGMNRIDVLIVGGGGAGGYAGDRTAGGGGGGGVIYLTNQVVTAGTQYSIYVGNGGGIYGGAGENGQASSFHTWSATGGGGGANSGNADTTGKSGGSGGGRYHNAVSVAGSGTAGQGYAGGPNGYDSGDGSTGTFTASGGGGAGGIGSSGTTSGGGAGGAAVSYTIGGVTYTVGGGGGGSAQSLGGQNLPGGAGGTNAGNGASSSGSLVIGGSAVANRGGGGGGGASGQYGGGGGSGIVVVRYYISSIIKIYIFVDDSQTIANQLKSNIETVATAIGQSVTVIAVGAQGSSATSLSYDSTVDVVVYWNNQTSPSGRGTQLQTYLDNGKGLVMSVFGHTNWSPLTNVGLSTSYQITTAGGYTSSSTSYSQTNPTNHPILNGVSSIIPSYYNTSFTSVNSATVIGNGPGGGLVMYKDYTTTRRVDINTYQDQSDTSSNSNTRLFLNACLWAANKI